MDKVMNEEVCGRDRIKRELVGRVYQRVLKGKVFYGQELPSGESTTAECGVNYQLLTVIY